MTDALERLKNRTRPTVRNRDTSLASSSPDVSTSSNPDMQESMIAKDAASIILDISTSGSLASQKPTAIEVSASMTPDISTSRHEDFEKPMTDKVSVPGSLDTSTSRLPGIQSSRYSEVDVSRVLDAQSSIGSDTSGSLSQESATSSSLGTETGLKTKQSTLRLEQGVGDRLQDLCHDQGICREVLIEALFEFGEAHPDVLSVVLTAAKVKHGQRQRMANQRRAQSMMQRFGQT